MYNLSSGFITDSGKLAPQVGIDLERGHGKGGQTAAVNLSYS